MKCSVCKVTAVVALPNHSMGFCEECFFRFFTRQVKRAIRKHNMFTYDDRILVALSGGKDSLALMYELNQLGYNVTGLHVDLCISNSSTKARQTVERFCEKHELKLRVVELAEEDLAIPDVKQYVNRPICSMCGKIKRYFFNKVAREEGFNVLATGHNLDDEVGRLFANTLRWDQAYLADQGPVLPATTGFAAKVKPLCRLTEFETANYSFLRGIDYHTDPCPYSSGATFTGHKKLLMDLEIRSPGQKFQFYNAFLKNGKPAFQAVATPEEEIVFPCEICGSPTCVKICGVCRVRKTLKEKREEAIQADLERDRVNNDSSRS
ncbi:MAG: TIGR00269 family protein [Desulfovibrio sp.]